MNNEKRKLSKITFFNPEFKFTSEVWFRILLGMVWTSNTLVDYFRAILVRIPFILDIKDYIVTVLYLVLTMLSLPYILKQSKFKLIMLYMGVLFLYFINYLLFPNNQKALGEYAIPFLINSVPLIFVGVSVNLQKSHKMLYYLSLVSVAIIFVHHVLIEPVNFVHGDMHSAYQLLPHVCLALLTSLFRRRYIEIAISALGVLTLLAYGSRGPILCLCVLIILYLVFYERLYRSMWKLSLIIAALLFVVYRYEVILKALTDLIESIGMSTRVLDMLTSGDVLISNGRDVILGKLWEAIAYNPLGYGIAGDRQFVKVYAHNLLVELWVSYGVVFGTLLFAIFAGFLVKYMIRKLRNVDVSDAVVFALIASSVVKLFMSGTYLSESFLFLLLGILISEFKKTTVIEKSIMDNRYTEFVE